jgi:hypothetical protein
MNIDEYEKFYKDQISLSGTQSQFNSIGLPLIRSITLGNKEKMEEIESEIKLINRDNKIKSIVEDVDFKETKIQDHPDYSSASGLVSRDLISIKPLPPPSMAQFEFYMDFTYEKCQEPIIQEDRRIQHSRRSSRLKSKSVEDNKK